MDDWAGIGKIGEALINKVGEAVWGSTRPWQIKRVAEAEADASIIRAKADLQIQGMNDEYALRFVAEEVRKQGNIDAILGKALKQLPQDARPDDMENDWLSHFFDKARAFSDEEVQEVWAKILAGEANRPGTFARQTISCLADMDRADADLFRHLWSFVIKVDGRPMVCVLNPTKEVFRVSEEVGGFGWLHQLESLGLVAVVIGGMGPGRCTALIKGGECVVEYRGRKAKITAGETEKKLRVGYVRLTRSGKELGTICESRAVPGFWEMATGFWGKRGLGVEEL